MAKLSQTLQGLIERAERKGTAIKRVREGAIMGIAGHYTPNYREWVKTTPMVEQWKVIYEVKLNQDGSKTETYTIEHYETPIAVFRSILSGGYTLESWYGESNSDRDALNGLCSYFGVDARFSYRPSIDEFIMIEV